MYYSVHASSRDNAKHLPPNYISDLEKNYPPSWVEKFLDGNYGFIINGKPCYESFSDDWHCPKSFPGHASSIPIHRYWDFGYRRPAVIWAQKTSEGQLRLYKEMMGHNEYLQQFAPKIIQAGNERFPGCTFLDYCDPAGTQKRDSGKPSVVILREQFNIRCIFRPTIIDDGLELIQRQLLTMVQGEPAIIINASECPTIVNGFKGGFAKDTTGTVIKDGFYEHLHDALRYGVVNVFGSNVSSKQDFPIGGPSYITGRSPQMANTTPSPWRIH